MEVVEESKGGGGFVIMSRGWVCLGGRLVRKKERKKEPRHKRVSSIPGLATTARSRFRS